MNEEPYNVPSREACFDFHACQKGVTGRSNVTRSEAQSEGKEKKYESGVEAEEADFWHNASTVVSQSVFLPFFCRMFVEDLAESSIVVEWRWGRDR